MPELILLVSEQIERVKALSRTLNRVVPYLFSTPERGGFKGCGFETSEKTRSVFDRYNITSDADLREAARKLHRHNLGTIRSPLVDTVHTSALN